MRGWPGLPDQRAEMDQQDRRFLLRGLFARIVQGTKRFYFDATGRSGEDFKNGELPRFFGFASRPHPGTEVHILTVGGDGTHAIAIADTDPDRPCPVELEYGESCIYNGEGDYVHIKADRSMDVYSEAKITIKSDAEIALSAPQISLHSPSIDHYDSELT